VRRANPEATESLVSGRPPLELRIAGALCSHLPHVRTSDVVVAKSVHAVLAIDWIADRFDVDLLVILRHPANVLSSWLELDLPDRDRDLGRLPAVKKRYLDQWGIPPAGGGTIERAAWQLGLLTSALEHSLEARPHWLMRTHEQLCSDPEREFRRLFADLDLEWGSDTSRLLEQGDNPGTGFSLNRKASELAESWRGRLDAPAVETLSRVLRQFPVKTWDPIDLSACVIGKTDWLEQRSRRPSSGEP
jgi:hypothetical protein